MRYLTVVKDEAAKLALLCKHLEQFLRLFRQVAGIENDLLQRFRYKQRSQDREGEREGESKDLSTHCNYVCKLINI